MADEPRKQQPTNGEDEGEHIRIGPQELEGKPVKVKVVDRRFWARKKIDPESLEGDASAFDERSLRPTYVQELEQRYNETVEKLQAVTEAFQRIKVEQENFRIRIQKQKEHSIFEFKKKFFNHLLEFLDNFDRALEAIRQNPSPDTIVAGLEMMADQFSKILESEGLVRIAPEGEPYDPSLAEVVEVIPTDDPKKDHRVAEVVQPGFKLNDLLLRPARVKVYRLETSQSSKSANEAPSSSD